MSRRVHADRRMYVHDEDRLARLLRTGESEQIGEVEPGVTTQGVGLALYKGKQIRIYYVGVGRQHAVRIARIDFDSAIFQELDR